MDQYTTTFMDLRKYWRRKLLIGWVVFWILVSLTLFFYMSSQASEERKESLASMCDKRATMFQDGLQEQGHEHVSSLNFGDPFTEHEMRYRLKQKQLWSWLAITTSIGILVIALLVGYIFHATVNRIATVENNYNKIMELRKRAEAADVARLQFLRRSQFTTPMNGVLAAW